MTLVICHLSAIHMLNDSALHSFMGPLFNKAKLFPFHQCNLGSEMCLLCLNLGSIAVHLLLEALTE